MYVALLTGANELVRGPGKSWEIIGNPISGLIHIRPACLNSWYEILLALAGLSGAFVAAPRSIYFYLGKSQLPGFIALL